MTTFVSLCYLEIRLHLNYYVDVITGALNALKRKKRLETQLTQIDGTLSIIEFQREALENAQSNAEVLKIMSLAAKALKHAQQNL